MMGLTETPGNRVAAIPHTLYTWDSRTLGPAVVTELFIYVSHSTPIFQFSHLHSKT
jgi:hypothetical protein